MILKKSLVFAPGNVVYSVAKRTAKENRRYGSSTYVNSSYIDNETFEEHYVSVPEQGGGKDYP